MSDPWRIGVVGSEDIPLVNRYVYARLKELKADWPKATFEVVAATTGTVGRTAVAAARRLGMQFRGTTGEIHSVSERLIAWLDFGYDVPDEATLEVHASIAGKVHTEVYDQFNEPAGWRFA